jgi:microcystin-dependent protein
MTEPFVGELRVFSFNFPPKGWAFCNGQLLPINQNQALFALLGTTYGGDGRVNFALPNLQGRVPIHRGGGHVLGEAGGETSHTLTAEEMPKHAHDLIASSAAGTTSDVGAGRPAAVDQLYGKATSLTRLHPKSVTSIGGSQPHTNLQPLLTLTICIALQGIFPSH